MISKLQQLGTKTKKKRVKHSEKVKLDRKLVGGKGTTGVWSTLVKQRANNKCEVCGSTENLNAHHVEGRRNERLRYSLENGVSLCPLHHTFGKQSAHQSPLWFDGWLQEKRPWSYNYVKEHMNEVKKWTEEELRELLDEYINLLKEL